MESAALTVSIILAAALLYRAGYRNGFETGVDSATKLLFGATKTVDSPTRR